MGGETGVCMIYNLLKKVFFLHLKYNTFYICSAAHLYWIVELELDHVLGISE